MSQEIELDPRWRTQIVAHLADGEYVRFAVRPDPVVAAREEATPCALGTLLAVFTFFLALGVLREVNRMDDLRFTVILLVFAPLVIGTLWLLTHPVVAIRQAARTLYVLTDRRALVIAPQQVTEFSQQEVAAYGRRRLDFGTGHLVFSRKVEIIAPRGLRRETLAGFLNLRNLSEAEWALHRLLLGTPLPEHLIRSPHPSVAVLPSG